MSTCFLMGSHVSPDAPSSLLAQPMELLLGRGKRRKAAPNQQSFEPLVTAPFVSVASRVVHVLRSIVTGRVASLRALFNRGGSRSQMVATFLAVLELIRAGRIEIDDQETLTVRRGRMKKQES